MKIQPLPVQNKTASLGMKSPKSKKEQNKKKYKPLESTPSESNPVERTSSDSEKKEIPKHYNGIICSEDINFFQTTFQTSHLSFETPEQLIHALCVIASLKPNERISTARAGIFVQPKEESWSWFTRWLWGESRLINLKHIRCVFLAMFHCIDKALDHREKLKDHFKKNRPNIIELKKNTQFIQKSVENIYRAKLSIDNLKSTYTHDAHTVANINLLVRKVDECLELVRTSLGFIDKDENILKDIF